MFVGLDPSGPFGPSGGAQRRPSEIVARAVQALCRQTDAGAATGSVVSWRGPKDQPLIPLNRSKVVGSSSLMGIHPDGRAFPFTWQTVTLVDGRTQAQGRTLPHDRLYEVTGRGSSDSWTPPRTPRRPRATSCPGR